MDELRQNIVDAVWGKKGLPVMAHSGEDPGHEYFMDLTRALRTLLDHLKGQAHLDRELSCALYALGCHVDRQYQAAVGCGMTFRDDLFDPDILNLEAAVESIFADERIEFMEGI